MAGQIIVSSIKTDSDNSISFLANTGATIFSANLASGLSASSVGNNTITSDKIVSVANTKITGNIISSQITSVANTQLTGNIISSQITSVANTAIVGLIEAAQIGSANASVISAGTLAGARLPAGSVLQVIQALKTDTQSTSSATYVDVTGLSVTITPTSASSKILVMIRINAIANDAAAGTYFNILRGATSLVSSTAGGQADTENSWGIGGGGGMTFNDRKISSAVLDYLDSPNTTSATTYKIQFLVTTNVGYINAWATNTDLAAVSSITVMEIAA